MELSKLYEQVTAVREDAMVPALEYRVDAHCNWAWRHNGVWQSEYVALALIGWHWLGLLKQTMCLIHETSGKWCVAYDMDDSLETLRGPTRIEALAAYLLATAKEAK